MAIGRDLKNKDNHVVCIVGDGAMSAGQAYEALNNAGAEKSKLIVILNDNDMSIAPCRSYERLFSKTNIRWNISWFKKLCQTSYRKAS